MKPCDLSSDVMFEILSRMPLKMLRRCRLLSRECNSLTYESSFMRLHCQRTNTIAGYFIQTSKKSRGYSTFCSIDNPGVASDQLTLDFLPETVHIRATADQGLMLCESQRSQNRYYVCKPGTRQWETIPNPNPRYFTCKTAMLVIGSDPLRFKLVRLSDPEPKEAELESEYSEPELDNYRRYPCEIFDSEIWAWKQLDDVMLSYDEFFDLGHAISAYGGLHWLTSTGDKKNILSFNEDKESWESVSLPESFCHGDHCYHVNLAEYEGKLALIYQRPEIPLLELWVMKDYYGKLWSKKHRVNLADFCKENGFYSAYTLYNADMIFMQGYYTAIFYNFKNGQFDRLRLPSTHMFSESAFFFQTDYEPIILRQPREKLSMPHCYSTLIFMLFLLFVPLLISFTLGV
ncbi:F-box associated ubiquitination effector family protein, putative [Theobroma cacao]|uniref:F-box associated ubiquitination effector family protein, putative n=1 Tax=Theobroma cacao TaxID=3641 RepID=A0A061GMD8_THECC|nr:F-box associated ubiquitination effector family protein, putative [Theobroma cacao]